MSSKGPILGQPLHLQNLGVHDIIQFTTYNLLIDTESFLKFLDGCPIFILSLVSLLKGNTSTLLVSFPLLKWLDITFDDMNHYSDLIFNLNAPSLEYLNFGYYIIREFILNNLPILIEAYIDFGDGTIG
ncbi:hypothetical protein M9H77_22154 [Catharanthus roseus]|uniref:Uncharacterized protein n=1 Tax=Catharanthus roseus TaxID=4058 RepID=A0ACC0AQ28_CATRO|nr:hypothetical protein M9H77_22154 [Catharanthus roseus]